MCAQGRPHAAGMFLSGAGVALAVLPGHTAERGTGARQAGSEGQSGSEGFFQSKQNEFRMNSNQVGRIWVPGWLNQLGIQLLV